MISKVSPRRRGKRKIKSVISGNKKKSKGQKKRGDGRGELEEQKRWRGANGGAERKLRAGGRDEEER